MEIIQEKNFGGEKVIGCFIDEKKEFYDHAYDSGCRYFWDDFHTVELFKIECENAYHDGDSYIIKDCGRNRSHLWIYNCPAPCIESLSKRYKVFGYKSIPTSEPTKNWMGGMECFYDDNVYEDDAEWNDFYGFLFMSTKEIDVDGIKIIRIQPSKSGKTNRIWYWISAKDYLVWQNRSR